ncbi:MAG: hypothetical protein WCC90_11470, partial [Methylocella sp.]
ETGGWVITGASSHHWSGRGRQSTAIAEPAPPVGEGHSTTILQTMQKCAALLKSTNSWRRPGIVTLSK